MRILIIGLGSMGRRRIRNLQEIGVSNIAGFDLRNDRVQTAKSDFGIKTYSNFQSAVDEYDPNVFIISTSPESHLAYARFAEAREIDCFLEASVVDSAGIRELANKIRDRDLIFAPSCTMKYFPGPKWLSELLKQHAIGKILTFNYQTGQYLPDWHPWENINEFYVSKRETGGAREIVPFELTWLKALFGEIKVESCFKSKIGTFSADIDDYYQFNAIFGKSVFGSITIEVLSRPVAVREMRIIGSEGMIVLNSEILKFITTRNPNWETISFVRGTKIDGYINPEEPYVLEMRDFLNAVNTREKNNFPNSLEADANILDILTDLETLSEKNGL